MKKIKSKQGYMVCEVSVKEIVSFGGLCICDSCNKDTAYIKNYLILVLNRCYCQDCFDRWNDNHKMYIEDLLMEKNVLNMYRRYFYEQEC